MPRKDNKGRNLHTGESQRKDGLYMYRYTDFKSGKRQTVYAKDLPELRQKEKQISKDMNDDILTENVVKKMTVNTLFERYLKVKMLSDATRTDYQRLWDRHVKSSIGNIRVVTLRQSHICTLYAEMSRNGYSYTTIKLIHSILHATLETAVDDDMIRKNPSKKALSNNYGEAPKEKTALTLEQQKNLFAFMRDSNVYHVYVPMFTIMLGTALRCGELIGLTWKDVNTESGELSVNHQLIYKNLGDGYKFYATTPKTDAGIRTIPLTKTVCKAFKEQREINFILGLRYAGEIDGYSDFIFLTKNDNVLMPSALNNVIYNIVDAYNKAETENAKKEHRNAELLPKFSAHDLRHTACTNMARQNMNIKALQEIMGHAHCNVTLDVYNHVTSKLDMKEEMERYEKAVGN